MSKKLLTIGIIGCCLLVGIMGYEIGNITVNSREIKSNGIDIMHVVDDTYVIYSDGNVTTLKLIDTQEIS